MKMHYRRLGQAGLQVSALSFGSWVTYGNQVDSNRATELMSAARDYGVNFFDNAEVYADGQSEILMGEALAKLRWDRLSYIVSTKFFWGLSAKFRDGINERNTLNRKYLMQAIDGSLKRLKLEHVDLVYCHRADVNTSMEEVVFAMHDIITSGKALYWGTSEWSATEFAAAWQIADKHHLHKPVVEQPQYNLFHRHRLEKEYKPLFAQYGMGTTTWSPLASGQLTGKYLAGVPADSRANLKKFEWLKERMLATDKNAAVQTLTHIALECGVTPAQLAIAWCLKNPNVSTVITGASRISQLHENMGALDALEKLSPDVMAAIDVACIGHIE
jgi:voltage-dependent potassium channel beta subunit